jgi:hypothetical protein
MKGKPETKTVGALIKLIKAQMLKANPEYQRGVVWSETQKKKLVDSVLRGYPIPLIYLHHIKTEVEGMKREDLEIIDGQQRLHALYEFSEGAFSLFHPVDDDKKAKFPAFIKKLPCPWGGKDFASLPAQLQKQLLATPLNVAKIESSEMNEVRDLFVRLQSGLPLKDPNRLYGELDRTILFFRQGRHCLVCDGDLDWRYCEVHHVEEHSKGGQTSLENGAALHKKCHPKGAQSTKAFAKKFAAWRATQEQVALD